METGGWTMTLKPYRNYLLKGAMAANDITTRKLAEVTSLSTVTLTPHQERGSQYHPHKFDRRRQRARFEHAGVIHS
jgi:hypothetical protein